jgi:hypothetical protein
MQQFKQSQSGLTLIQTMLIIAAVGVAATVGIRMWLNDQESRDPGAAVEQSIESAADER